MTNFIVNPTRNKMRFPATKISMSNAKVEIKLLKVATDFVNVTYIVGRIRLWLREKSISL